MNTSTRKYPSAYAVAKYLLYLGERDSVSMDQLKIQTILYYCQGWSLSLRGYPLFREKIEAWGYCPVIPVIWHELTEWEDALDELSEDNRDFPQAVWESYSAFSGTYLAKKTREPGGPWKKIRGPLQLGERCNLIIPRGLMRDFFTIV